MYVCSKCNRVVDQPGRRWWSGWRYGPDGHVLYVPGLGPSLEQSFWKSFLRGLARSMIVFGLIVLTLALAPDYRARPAVTGIGLCVAVFYLFTALKAHLWAGRAGPVQRLATHARGRAYGFLAGVLCQLGITIPLPFAN